MALPASSNLSRAAHDNNRSRVCSGVDLIVPVCIIHTLTESVVS